MHKATSPTVFFDIQFFQQLLTQALHAYVELEVDLVRYFRVVFRCR